MTATYMIAAATVAAVLILFSSIRLIRSCRHRSGSDRQSQLNKINTDLKQIGFAYEQKGDYFYSLVNCWQRKVGYCRLYDEAAPMFNMIIDCEPVTFTYTGKRWLIEFWKGQYGIMTGGEIGVYNTDRADIDTHRFQGTFYENIQDSEMLKMSFVLQKDGKVILKRKAVHWWLTGFKPGMFSETESLSMNVKITFPTVEMKNAFTGALKKLGYSRREYSARRHSVFIHFTAPHSPQPESRTIAREALTQLTNSNNCKLYRFAKGQYSDTLDKLEYMETMMPELYSVLIKSLHAKEIYYEAFDWIKYQTDSSFRK